MNEPLILVDSDSIYFRAAYSASSKAEIQKSINYTMKEIQAQCFMGDFKVAIKGKGNFRNDLYPKYKANRPELAPEMKEKLNHGYNYMLKTYDAVPGDDMEADDLCSIWAHECREMELSYAVVGIDKDLLQIPGNHYNFVKRTHTFMDDDAADKHLMLQCLTGDNSDNIPGIRGIGPKKAAGVLDKSTLGRRWGRVRATWRAKGAGSPDLSRRLLQMITSWEEFNAIRSYVQSETPERQRYVWGAENVQVESVSTLPERDT